MKLFSPDSKLWIFSSIDILNKTEEKYINKEISEFLYSWNAHGKKMKSKLYIMKSHFIIIIVNSNFTAASGCSIDSLYRKIKEIGNKLNINFSNQDYIPFMKNKSSKKIEFLKFLKFKNCVKNNYFNDECIVFDNSINLLSELDNWQLNLKDWKSKFMIKKKGLK